MMDGPLHAKSTSDLGKPTIYVITIGVSMNIFYLDKSPIVSAQLQCDKHVVKMILESAQLLCTAHRVLDYTLTNDHDQMGLYKITHKNHPSAVWARSGYEQYSWLYHHFIALGDEYEYRYHKRHLTILKLKEPLSFVPYKIKDTPFTDPPLCMPEEYKQSDNVLAYQDYYRSKRTAFTMSWTKRPQPSWF